MRNIRFILMTILIYIFAFVGLSPTNSTVLIVHEEVKSGMIIKGRIETWDIVLDIHDLQYDYEDTTANTHIYQYCYRIFEETELSSFKTHQENIISQDHFDTLFGHERR